MDAFNGDQSVGTLEASERDFSKLLAAAMKG